MGIVPSGVKAGVVSAAEGVAAKGLGVREGVGARLDDVEDCDGVLIIGIGLRGGLRGPVGRVEIRSSCLFSKSRS
jgi:hypothetical protein